MQVMFLCSSVVLCAFTYLLGSALTSWKVFLLATLGILAIDLLIDLLLRRMEESGRTGTEEG